MLEIKDITSSNLPDAARLCLAGKSLTDRPRAFTRDRHVHIEHPLFEARQNPILQPSSKLGALSGVAALHSQDADLEFKHRDGRKPEGARRSVFRPSAHGCVGACGFAEFRNDIRIQ